MSDLLQAEIDRVYGEYYAARTDYEQADKADPNFPLVRDRFNEAGIALHNSRSRWRAIGEAAGTRTERVLTVDEDGTEPDQLTPAQQMIPDRWTERRFNKESK